MHLYPHEPIGDVLARIRKNPMLYVDTTTGTIRTHEGGEVLAHYSLEKKRRWNIGLRRHAYELTGRIQVQGHDRHGNYGVATFDNWPDVKSYVAKLEGMK